MSIDPTPEQAAIVDAFQREAALVITAGAGAGKTSTLKLCAAAAGRHRGVYVAYNKAIATDAAASFPANTSCKTAHSLAFGAVGRTYSRRLNGGRIPARRVAELLGIREILSIPIKDQTVRLAPQQVARLVMGTTARFCYSDAEAPRAWDVPELAGVDGEAERELRAAILPLARKAWADIERVDGVLPFTHDCYLKLWQLQGARIPCDFLFLDEAQDANPVVAAIVAAQADRAQLVLVGDSCQQLYAWRGAVDAMDTFPADERLTLSQSFRFGPAVAAEANKWLGLLRSPLTLRGYDAIPSRVDPDPMPAADAVLTRTNAGAMSEVMAATKAGVSVALVGGDSAIRRLAEAAVTLKAGKGTDHPDLLAFQDWGQLQDYVQHDEGGGDLRAFVSMIDRHGSDVVLDTLDHLVDEGVAQLTVSTAHKAKGREWHNVRVGADFSEPREDGDGPSRSEAMLAYVTVTRAQRTLDRGSLTWIDDWYPTRRKPAPAAQLELAGGAR